MYLFSLDMENIFKQSRSVPKSMRNIFDKSFNCVSPI